MSDEGSKWIHAEYILPPEFVKMWNERLQKARAAMESAETEEVDNTDAKGAAPNKASNPTSDLTQPSVPCEDDPACA